VPERFHVNDDDNERNWFYTGREKFVEVLDKFEQVRKDCSHSDLTIYGTRGYGKSHLLAALVCHLTARGVKVVYIPDCRDFVESPVEQLRAAMLFAWADDENKQQIIMALDTQDEISRFFRADRDAVFAIDQLNALEKEKSDDEFTANAKAQWHAWLESLMEWHKAILSSSANNYSILNRSCPVKESSSEIMYVHGGLTRVSLRK
jgi:chromosomal replication initiation ATPase DnaA